MKSNSDGSVLNEKEENHQQSNENGFSCRICEKKYKKEHLLAKHLLAHANNEKIENNEQISETDISKRSECKTCGQKFRFFKALQKHEKRHEGSGGFICGTCNIPFTTADAREKHRNREHKVLRCKICNTRFESSEEYLRHINTLHDGRDRELSICSECGKQFKTKGELTHHVSSKCGTVKKYKCSVCCQTLMTAGSLHNHMLRHTGKRTYMCRFCAKTFLTAGQLTVHERIHTQEKAFVCEVCNKGFCHRQSLITHSTLHTGIKPYVCENCGNAFSCVGNLLKHRKTHADSCGRSDLRTHRVLHPATKLKVQINTPPASKIKTLEKRKKLETVENTQNSNTNTWKHENSNHFPEPAQKENENFNNYNYPENNYNQVNGFTQNEFQLSEIQNMNYRQNVGAEEYIIPDLIPDLPVESSIPVKQEHWLQSEEQTQYKSNNVIEPNKNKQPTIENAKQNISSEANNHRTQEIQIKKEQEVSHSEEIQSENEDQNFDTDWQNFDSDVSEDSVDLNTRKMNLEMKNNKKNDMNSKKKKVKNRDKITVNADELKKFVEERGFDKSKGMGCKYCNAHYFVPLWLLKHERRHEADETGGPSQKPRPKCSCCSRTFATKEECLTHQQTEHADQLTCKECDKIFANPDSMKAHVNFYHRGVPRKKYTYVCKECGKLFKQKEVLLRHEQNNCGDGPFFQCPICQKSFTSKHVQRTHMRIHLPDKSLLCKFCGKSFHWKGQLKIHERSHTGEKPFKCQHCPKSFAYRESLITHSTLHSGIKPHLCESCGSRFSCIGNLLKHRRTHAKAFGLSNNQSVKTEPTFIPNT